jgi:MoaA/NifB/PqqE/SkfB family radical SAM enzyme
MNFFEYSKLHQMHIELTNACNAACPMCARFYNNSPLLRPDIEISRISLEQFTTWFPPEVINKTGTILFCGTYGDPCMAKDFLEIFNYIAETSDSTVVIVHTNGGMRKADWWRQVGQLFAKKTFWQIMFSIDGLEDTNHIYRRNVVWKQLMENTSAFINAGGKANWEFLMFGYNEHQVDQARELASTMKFQTFLPKKALGVDDGYSLLKMPVVNRDGELDYYIEAPRDPSKRNLEIVKGAEWEYCYPFTVEDYKKLKENNTEEAKYKELYRSAYDIIDPNSDQVVKQNSCKIECRSKMWRGIEIYIDSAGYVLPCCYVGTHVNSRNKDFKHLQLHNELEKAGWDNFSLHNRSLKDILDSRTLDKVFTDSWEKDSILDGKMAFCSDTCGTVHAIDRIYTQESKDALKRLR